jgi:hypothetical protein
LNSEQENYKEQEEQEDYYLLMSTILLIDIPSFQDIIYKTTCRSENFGYVEKEYDLNLIIYENQKPLIPYYETIEKNILRTIKNKKDDEDYRKKEDIIEFTNLDIESQIRNI